MTRRFGALVLTFAFAVAACGGDPATQAAPTSPEGSTTTSTMIAAAEGSSTTTTVPGLEVDDDGRTIAVVSGAPLPQLPGSGTDTAIGMTIPTAEGRSVDGSLMTIGPRNEPQAIVFLAHWCPHCRDEVSEYSSWLATSSMPEGTSLVAVATAIDPLRQNYPPEDWLDDEDWPVPTLVDPSNEVAAAFGLTAFPFWVLVDADGVVVIRGAGGIAPDAISDALTTIANGPTVSG